MPIRAEYLNQTIRQGMDHYWRVVYSETDDGLDATELKWKRSWELQMDEWADKWDKVFSS